MSIHKTCMSFYTVFQF